MASNWPPGHYPMRPEEVLNEEELAELRRSGQALYRDGSKPPNTTTNYSELDMSRVDPHEAIWSLTFERGEETSAVSLESILDEIDSLEGDDPDNGYLILEKAGNPPAQFGGRGDLIRRPYPYPKRKSFIQLDPSHPLGGWSKSAAVHSAHTPLSKGICCSRICCPKGKSLGMHPFFEREAPKGRKRPVQLCESSTDALA